MYVMELISIEVWNIEVIDNILYYTLKISILLSCLFVYLLDGDVRWWIDKREVAIDTYMLDILFYAILHHGSNDLV